MTLVALAAYCLLTGGSSPTVRATVLWALYGLGRLCHRRGDPLTLLSAAAGIILLAAPAQLTAAGFQLSFGAMVGIGLVTPWLKRLHCPQGRASRWVWNALCLTAGAQTGLLLPLCWWFQQLPLLGLMANLVVFPWASMLIYLYLLTTATLGIPGVRETLGAWAAACSRATVTAVQALAAVPGAYLWTARPGLLGWLGRGRHPGLCEQQKLVAQAYPLHGGRYGGAVLCGVGDACVTAHHHLDAAERGHRRCRGIGDRRRGLGH